jgi:hypothetical protein
MKELNRFFRPRILLVATALAAAGSLGAQTTGTTTSNTPPTSSDNRQVDHGQQFRVHDQQCRHRHVDAEVRRFDDELAEQCSERQQIGVEIGYLSEARRCHGH